MGRDKAFVQVGGREMLDRLLEVGRSVSRDCVLVVNDPDPYREAVRRYGWEARPAPAGGGGRFQRRAASLRLVTDRQPGLGPVAGMEAGLGAAERALCFVSACDLPFLGADVVTAVLRALDAHRAEAADPDRCAVVPVADGRRQPLAAAYARGAAREAARCLEARELRMDDLLGRLEVRTVPAEELAGGDAAGGGGPFANVNSPEELRDARRRAGSAGAGP